MRAFLENHLFVLFLHKSWIWRTLGHVMDIFSSLVAIFILLQKDAFVQEKSNFMHGFKSAILEKFKNCQVYIKAAKSQKKKIDLFHFEICGHSFETACLETIKK